MLYVAIGAVLAVAFNRVGLLRTEAAIHVIMGFYAGVIAVALLERKWPLVLYYASAIGISIAVLWMASQKSS